MITGKTKINPEERDQLREKKLRMKDRYEVSHMGDMYEQLYPLPEREDS